MLLIFTLPTVFHPVFRNGSNFAKLTMVFTGRSSGRFFFFWGGANRWKRKSSGMIILPPWVMISICGRQMHCQINFYPVTECLWLKLHNASFMIPIHNWSTSTPLLYICNWFTPVSYVGYDQRRSHGGILGILGSPREPHGPQEYGPERSMKLLAEERRVSGNGNWPKTEAKKEGGSHFRNMTSQWRNQKG